MRGLLPSIKLALSQSKSLIETPLWTLTQVTGDLNHCIYHCQSVRDNQLDLMVKVFDHTDDKRAWREYSALRSLWTLDIDDVSPAPLLLLESYIAPDIDVLITEWLHVGEITLDKTLNKIQWTAILHTLLKVHQITPKSGRVTVSDALNRVEQPIDYLKRLQQDCVSLANKSIDRDLLKWVGTVLGRVKNSIPHQWAGDVATVLIHGDWHLHNFAMTDGEVRFFDWEAAGWGDAAMDIATLLTHETFADVSPIDQRWLTTTYQNMMGDEGFARRVDVYTQLLDVEWLLDTMKRQQLTSSDAMTKRLDFYRVRLERRYPLID